MELLLAFTYEKGRKKTYTAALEVGVGAEKRTASGLGGVGRKNLRLSLVIEVIPGDGNIYNGVRSIKIVSRDRGSVPSILSLPVLGSGLNRGGWSSLGDNGEVRNSGEDELEREHGEEVVRMRVADAIEAGEPGELWKSSPRPLYTTMGVRNKANSGRD